jgi:hypothetical protein
MAKNPLKILVLICKPQAQTPVLIEVMELAGLLDCGIRG